MMSLLWLGRTVAIVAVLVVSVGYTPPAHPALLPDHISGRDLVAAEIGPADELDCVPLRIRPQPGDVSQLQCRSMMGRPTVTVVGTASFTDGRTQRGAIGCGDITPDMAPPQRYPLACVWLPNATEASLTAQPRP